MTVSHTHHYRKARLDELQQTCSAPSDGHSAGVWCEAANEAVSLAVHLHAELFTMHGRALAAEARLRRAEEAIRNSVAVSGAAQGGGATSRSGVANPSPAPLTAVDADPAVRALVAGLAAAERATR